MSHPHFSLSIRLWTFSLCTAVPHLSSLPPQLVGSLNGLLLSIKAALPVSSALLAAAAAAKGGLPPQDYNSMISIANSINASASSAYAAYAPMISRLERDVGTIKDVSVTVSQTATTAYIPQVGVMERILGPIV